MEEKRERFLFWERCQVCKGWKLIKNGRWSYEDKWYWKFICDDCMAKGEWQSKLTTK